ncbi:hypothetical protein HYX58_04745 [Candidatus Dependentiae bacterium]|nr:hypothetical protein [Candidatus Dependentiae bacterium]
MKRLYLLIVLITIQSHLIYGMGSNSTNQNSESADQILARFARLNNDEKKAIAAQLNKLPTVPEIQKTAPALIAEAEERVKNKKSIKKG